MHTLLVAAYLFFESSALHVVRDLPQQVILVNTPKCATGSLETAFVQGLPCQDKTDVRDQGFVVTSCPDGSLVFRTHELGAATNYFNSHHLDGPQKGKCVLVTAFRNPLSQLKSKFFESHKTKWCEGKSWSHGNSSDADGIRNTFKAWIELSRSTDNGVDKTYNSAVLARMYGLQNYSAVLHGVSDLGGLLRLDSSIAPAGEFGDCELLILQLEKLKDQFTNIKSILPMMQEVTHESTLDFCPQASWILDAIETIELSPSEKSYLFEASPDLEAAWRFYGLDASTE